MKKLLFYLLLFSFVSSVLPLLGQSFITNSSVTGVCYAGDKVNRIYIPPPDEFFRKSGTKSGGSITIYYTGFSTEAKTTMEYAKTILESMLPADTKLTILANWGIIIPARVLANTSVTGFAGGWGIDALNPKTFYPVALAEKIAGKSLNSDLDGDLVLNVNSAKNWYLGTDGLTPQNKYDLVTVVLHEICHGLGFFSSMNSEASIGYYGISAEVMNKDSVVVLNDTLPMIYDTFIEDLIGNRLTDKSKYLNFSTDLESQLTGEQLYFNGLLLNKYTSGSRAKLYAPSTFDEGSSITHLDEDQTLVPNTLMTPFIDLGEAIHNPGKYTFSILGDLGWINTRIIHKPLGDTEKPMTEVVLSTRIKSDTLYFKNRVGVVYSFNKFRSSDTLYMISPNSDDSFETKINIPSYNTDLQYYFFVTDCFLRLYRSPSLYNLIRFQTYIGTDTVKPVIRHTPAAHYLESVDSINFKATVTDNLGIDSVYIEYKVNSGSSKYIGLIAGKNDSYSAFLRARQINLNGGDSLSYRIFARDSAQVANTAVLPKNGYFVIHIEDFGTVLESYKTDFTGAAPDFFNIGFSILKPKDFSKYGLHTKHPYESPETFNGSINYTAMLRHPLIFKESGLLINFREVVLVEPGEPGSVFGSADFYDYVIIEGSKNFGKSWFKLCDGYDSRWSLSWETAYNSSKLGDNSTFTGTESMLLKHTVYYRPNNNISAGDTLLLRFRLYSDPFANGWGWVIEDLKINPLIDAVENLTAEQLIVYPNPGRGLINVGTWHNDFKSSKLFRYSVFNSAGICLLNDKISGDTESVIDITGYPTGIYIIILYLDDGVRTIKYSLIK